ncbi:MAG: single-stranded DNA-binding protein [Parcubacteria group bacterium]|nr:single-stranded DNA-binding protein [Parcubacteria group bacterium]
MNLNKVIIVGRLTADPQLRNTPSGQAVCAIGVATNRVWTDKSGAKQESTEYHNVVLWGRQAEIASQFLTKGATVLIEGRLQTRAWQDKQGGQRKTTEIIAERMQLGPRPSGQQGQWSRDKGQETQQAPDKTPTEEVPVINLEEEGDIKAEDLPF